MLTETAAEIANLDGRLYVGVLLVEHGEANPVGGLAERRLYGARPLKVLNRRIPILMRSNIH